MSGEEGGSVVEADAENWVEKLAPDLPADEVARMGPDRDIFFEALVELLRGEETDGAEVRMPAVEESVAADAPLLLPGARLHIRVRPEALPTLKDALKVAISYVLSDGDPEAGIINLTIDAAHRILSKVTKLDEDELAIAMTLLHLKRGEGAPPTTAQLQAALPELEGLPARLEVLAEKGVVVGNSGGWVVKF